MHPPRRFDARRFDAPRPRRDTANVSDEGGPVVTWDEIKRINGMWGPAPIPDEFELGDEAERAQWLSLPTSARIRYAARALLVIRLRYRKLDGQFIDRLVEPYSYRVKRPKAPAPGEHGLERSVIRPRGSGEPGWYLFAFDRTRDQTIKSFLVRRIVHVEVTRDHYPPRWDVEF